MKVSNPIANPASAINNAESSKSQRTTNRASEQEKAAGSLGERARTQNLDSAKIDLSSRAQELRRAQELATPSMSSVDEAKVARLQKMIDEGSYSVDAAAIADRLLDEHLKMPT